VDEFPLAAPVKIPGRSSGPGGAVLQLFQTGFMPGGGMRVNFTAPLRTDVWVAVALGNETQSDRHLGQNLTGEIELTAPKAEGSYRLRMHDQNGTGIISLPFNVTVPEVSASPSSVYTCEKIIVAFRGASGRAGDWIGMYLTGSDQAVSRQSLKGRESGEMIFSSAGAGSFMFRMFLAGASASVAASNSVEAKANSGYKVTAEPSRVGPGGTVTVTYWGAPPEGTGVIGMYGMTRPDKFDLGKRPIGSQSCGSMTWQLPYEAGQYDFRMFHDDVNRPLLAQSNVVTVA
jgi:nitrous oxidase accessory protein